MASSGFMLLLLLLVVMPSLSLVEGDQKVRITIPNTLPASEQITPNFVGFSLEWFAIATMIADNSSGTASPIFVTLMQNLKSSSTIAPLFRIGGNSADQAWWNPDDQPPPNKGLTISIKRSDLQSLKASTSALNGKLVLGLNFMDGSNPQLAVDEAKAIGQYLSWDPVTSIEIGNEPDIFPGNGLRPHSWSYADYHSEFNDYAGWLMPYIPRLPFVQGGTYCCVPEWVGNFSQYISEETWSCNTYSRHIYPETHCGGHNVTLRQLLSNADAQGVARSQISNIRAAIAAKRPYWVGETNSISCSGEPGVSDAFGAALWASDYLFNLVNVGVSGANFHHTADAVYNSYILGGGTLKVQALFYGMLFFSEAIGYIPHVAKPTSSSPPQGYLTKAIVECSNDLIRVWSVIERRTNSLRIIIIHKDIQATQQASITIKVEDPHFASRRGVLLPLEAPDPFSTTGIRLAGQTFDGSDDGSIQGTFQPIGVNPNGQGVFSFEMRPATAAMLVIP